MSSGRSSSLADADLVETDGNEVEVVRGEQAFEEAAHTRGLVRMTGEGGRSRRIGRFSDSPGRSRGHVR